MQCSGSHCTTFAQAPGAPWAGIHIWVAVGGDTTAVTPTPGLTALCHSHQAMAASLGPKPLVAVGQVTSTPDKEQNFSGCAALVRAAARRGACLVFLPEGFDYIGRDSAQTLSLAESLDGDLMARYSTLAR